jgi:excinuclease UvrABC nuclease subunit
VLRAISIIIYFTPVDYTLPTWFLWQKNVKFETTRSVLEALILEQQHIKKYLPTFNTKEKDDKSYFALVITDEDFPRVVLARDKDIDKQNNLLIKSKFLGKIKSEKVKVLRVFWTISKWTIC